MNKSMYILLCSLMPLFANNIQATDQFQLAEKEQTSDLYAPVFFISNIKDIGFTNRLESYKAFERIDEKALGLPIVLRVLRSTRVKQDGSTVSTSLLSASTLFLTPVLKTTELSVRYDLLVNGKSIADFTYKEDNQGVESVWLNQSNQDSISPEEREFLLESIPKFLKDLKNSEKSQAVFEEYAYYFGAAS